MALEKKYESCPYLSREKRGVFAEKIGIPEKQVKTWFQNRRMKEKKINESSNYETTTGVKNFVESENVETSDEDDSYDEMNEVDDGESHENKKIRAISCSDDEKNLPSFVKNEDTTQVSSNKTNYLKIFLDQLDFIDKQYEENGNL